MYLIQYLFLPLQPFVWHPERIAIVSFAFLLGSLIMFLLRHKYHLCRYWLLLIPAAMWALFAAWEYYCKVQQYDIRVDLMLIYPVLMAVSILGLVFGITSLMSGFRREQRNNRKEQKQMNGIQKPKKYAIKTCCWLVKSIGAAVLFLFLAILIGEGPPNPFKVTTKELFVMFVLLTILIGLALAIWRQLIGGIFILAGIATFTIIGGIEKNWVFYAFWLIGLLNIFCWLLKKSLHGEVKQ